MQVEARFGEPGNKMASALRRCMEVAEPGVVGCVAQLVTVADRNLARLMSATYRGMMQLMVVDDVATQDRLKAHLASVKARTLSHSS